MMPTTVTRKSMTLGEGGTALAFVALAVSSIFVAARGTYCGADIHPRGENECCSIEPHRRHRRACRRGRAVARRYRRRRRPLDKVSFGTNWVAEAEHGGFYQAVADGTYASTGSTSPSCRAGRR